MEKRVLVAVTSNGLAIPRVGWKGLESIFFRRLHMDAVPQPGSGPPVTVRGHQWSPIEEPSQEKEIYRDYLRLDAAGSFDKMADLWVGIEEVDMFYDINIDIFE